MNPLVVPPGVPLPVYCLDKQGEPFGVRLLRADEQPGLEAFYAEFEPKRAAQGLPPLGAERVAQWLSAVLPDGVHLVVDVAGAIRGHAFLVPGNRDDEVEYAIFLDKRVRGRGVGTRVNEVAIAVARALGRRRLWLSVEQHNRPAIRSYQNVGFRFLPGTLFSDEVEMELELGNLPASPPPCAEPVALRS